MNRKVSAAALFAIIAISFMPGAGSASQPTGSLSPLNPPLVSGLRSHYFVADADDAAALFVNPAGLGARGEASFLARGTYWYDRLSELVTSVSLPNLGLGYMRQDTGLYKSDSYLAGLGAALVRQLYIGASLGWHHTNLPVENRSPLSFGLGFLARPHRFFSLAGVWRNANRPRFGVGRLEEAFTGGVSIRPLTERITFSGQSTFAKGVKPGWMMGGRFTLVPGIELFGSYMRDLAAGGGEPYEEFTAGVALGLGSTRVRTSTRSRLDGDFDYGRNSFALENRIAYVRNSITHRERCAEIEIGGGYLDEGTGFSLMGGREKDLHGLLREFESARRDDDIKGLFLKIMGIEKAFIGPVSANLCEIREAILRVKAAGKPVVAYMSDDAGAAELYLASAADRIFVPRESIVGMIGVSLEINRLKRLLAKAGIDWDYTTAGDYKSTFHTPYTDTTTSVQAEELRSLVEESYRLLVEALAEGRGIDPAAMRELSDGRPFSSEEAVEEKLVDAIGREKDARDKLGRLAGVRSPEGLTTKSVAGRTYWNERWKPSPAIAVVGAYGTILTGKSGRSFITGSRRMGSATVVRQLEAASHHPGVKAIVFRIDSGGGSAVASDEITSEIRRIREKEGIPVIASMGNIAGSGGYWIAMYADAIFADPFTVTGSIGAVFAKPVLERFYEKAGITNEVFKVGEHADALSTGRRMTEEEMDHISGRMNLVYDHFIDHVAEGRKLSPERVREIAGGRVYLGTQARGLRLVDRIGGLADAVRFAASEAGIADEYSTVYFKAFPGLFERLAGRPAPLSLKELFKALY